MIFLTCRPDRATSGIQRRKAGPSARNASARRPLGRWRAEGRAALAALLVLATVPMAAGTEPLVWLERVQARLDTLRSFRARFIQEYEPKAFSRRQRETGTVTFQRPAKMRWDYEHPEPKLALSDGARIWIYYPEDRRVDVEPLAQLGEEAPVVQILMGRWRLRERFRVESLERNDSEITLNLAPKSGPGGIKRVRITMAETALILRGVEAEEAGGNVLRYRFEEWQEGVETPAELFRFSPPPGTKVQEIR